PAVTGSVTPASPRASAPASTRDPAAILGDQTAGLTPPPKITSATGGTDPFSYFVQAGAYGRTEDAEQQRARLAMMGLEGRLTEREQAGRTVYRVRLGPFDKRGDAEAAKEKLAASGVEAALVRVQR
ncbi:MAG: SPOR domain-containing protein, partial [Rhizobiales bacterium]|nr:SPOR domain-containing protein [Rhizobacter sp.]